MDGERLRRLRKERGLTQRQVADYLNRLRFEDEPPITHQQVSQWERGDRPIPAKPRPLPGEVLSPDTDEPSMSQHLDELFQVSDDELWESVDRAPRGPYSPDDY